MRKSGTIARVFGIDIRLHYSWYFIFVLIAWSLSVSFFPHFFPNLSGVLYWSMGITAALLLFVSVLLHELSHSLVAKIMSIDVESITLFFFGGVAGITREDMKPKEEFLMAIAGPLFSLVLSGIFFLIHELNGTVFITAITLYLYQLNFVLAIFNMVPGFPLDGGRAFRAALHWYLKDLRRATYIAAQGGKFFAGVLIVLGIFGMFTGTGPGLWFILIGAFLYYLAGMSYEQVVIKEILDKVPVKDMLQDVPKLPPAMKISDFLRRYRSSDADAFLVADKGFAGVIDIQGAASGSMKAAATVKQLAQAIPPLPSTANCYTALQQLGSMNAIPVVRGKKVIGVVTRRMLMRRLLWAEKFGNA